MMSPFTKVIVLGWYDGVTAALGRCGACDKAFHVDMLAWDDDQVVRLYEAREIRTEDFDAVVTAHQAFDEPRWPVWYPNYPSHTEVDFVCASVQKAVGGGLLCHSIIASSDLASTIANARRMMFSDWNELIRGRTK